MEFVEYLHVLFSFLPPWAEIAVGVTLAFMVGIAIFKLVAFVMDILPFV